MCFSSSCRQLPSRFHQLSSPIGGCGCGGGGGGLSSVVAWGNVLIVLLCRITIKQTLVASFIYIITRVLMCFFFFSSFFDLIIWSFLCLEIFANVIDMFSLKVKTLLTSLKHIFYQIYIYIYNCGKILQQRI